MLRHLVGLGMILGALPAAYPDDPCNDAAMPKLESCLQAEDRGPCEDRIRQLYKRCEQKEPDQQPAHDTYRSPITTREELPTIQPIERSRAILSMVGRSWLILLPQPLATAPVSA